MWVRGKKDRIETSDWQQDKPIEVVVRCVRQKDRLETSDWQPEEPILGLEREKTRRETLISSKNSQSQEEGRRSRFSDRQREEPIESPTCFLPAAFVPYPEG